jgi:hypothetical protein
MERIKNLYDKFENNVVIGDEKFDREVFYIPCCWAVGQGYSWDNKSLEDKRVYYQKLWCVCARARVCVYSIIMWELHESTLYNKFQVVHKYFGVNA